MRVVIPIFAGFTALDAIGPYEVLRGVPGAEVVFAAERPGLVPVDGAAFSVMASAALADIESCDVMVVPGGPGARRSVTDTALLDWIRRRSATARWTTSVCTGSLLLGAAGLLEGLTATTHWSAVEQLESYGATYVARRSVFHERVATAAGVSAGIDMALDLAARLSDPVRAQVIQLWLEYDPQPPFTAGSLASASAEVRALAGAGR